MGTLPRSWRRSSSASKRRGSTAPFASPPSGGGPPPRSRPRGAADRATIARLRVDAEAAMAADPGRLILDLRETTFIDSSMLHLVVETLEWAARTGTQFAIVPGPPVVQRTFEVAGLSDRLPFVDVPRA